MIKVFLIVALSTDGYIAKDVSEPSTAWTSLADKKHFTEITKKAGVVVMGAKTFKTIGKALPERRTIVYSEEKINVPNIEITSLPPIELIAKLEKEGARELAICGGATIYTMFMKSKVVDSLYITIEPTIFGSGMKLFTEPITQNLSLVSTETKDSSVFLEYKVQN